MQFTLLRSATVRCMAYQPIVSGDEVLVPVVMMTADAVIWPSGAPGYEYVPESALLSIVRNGQITMQALSSGVNDATRAWDGMPIVEDHPFVNRAPVLLTDTMRAAQSFGKVTKPHYADGALRCTARLNVKRAFVVDDRARTDKATVVVHKCLTAAPVEVSIGGAVGIIEEDGIAHGKRYWARWQYIKPNHLAMGLSASGGQGACSYSEGCGVRAACDCHNGNDAKGEAMDLNTTTDVRALVLYAVCHPVTAATLTRDELTVLGIREIETLRALAKHGEREIASSASQPQRNAPPQFYVETSADIAVRNANTARERAAGRTVATPAPYDALAVARRALTHYGMPGRKAPAQFYDAPKPKV